MYFDAFTISALVDELLDTVAGGRIQDVRDVDETGLGLEIYANRHRHYLYLSADTHIPRVHLVSGKLRRGLAKPTQLGLVFRSYVEGGIVDHIHQPRWERLLHIEVSGPKGDVTIIIEPMERRSNLLLVRDGIIIDCLRRVGPEDNRYRLSLPSHEYVPPPPMTGRHDPLAMSVTDMLGIFEQNQDRGRKAFSLLSSRILGMSPLLAKEIVFRASGEVNRLAEEVDPEAIFSAMQELMSTLGVREWRPGVVDDDGIHAYSVYPLEHMPGWRPVDSISQALELYYGAPVGEEAYSAAKKPVFAAIEEARTRLRAKLASLQQSVTDDAERERLRQSGELILAYQYAIQPGQTELRALYDADSPELVIQLDPELSPVENAQRYFKRYNKAKSALQDVPRLIQEAEIELAYLDQLAVDLEHASNWPEIDDVQQALQARGYLQGKRKRIGGGGKRGPLKVVTPDGYVIWIGRNSRQNELVTFKHGSPQDLWLHARGVPGAHVIIRNDGRRISDELINKAASVAAYYSAHRNESRVIVDVTRRKYVKKMKGAGPGMVTYSHEQTQTVTPKDESILQER